MKKLFSIFVVLVLVIAIPATAIPIKAVSSLPNYEPIDMGAKLRETELPIDMLSLPDDYGSGNPIKLWLVLDDYGGYYFFDIFELRAVGNFTEIWVQVSLDWPLGDPRDTPVILDEQVEYILEEFENNIYPTDTTYFGDPDFHNGSDSLLEAWGYVPPGYYYEETGRNVILVSNIRDENYYDYEYPYYIAGFYSPAFEFYFDRNIINIDSYNWEDRIGPDVERPYLYESVIAHEYQHLLHDDYVPGDCTFMNEGFSMYAEILCGYGVSWSHVNHFLYTPDNSLTKWGDQGGINILADYGSAALWTIFLSELMGGADPFVTYYMETGIPGEPGINNALEHFGTGKTLDDVYYEWNLANYLHSTKGSPYTYTSVDLNPKTNPDVIPLNYRKLKFKPVSFSGSDFGSTFTIAGYDTGVVDLAPYSSDYILFTGWNRDATLYFDGGEASAVPYGWEKVGRRTWYSNGVNLLNTLLAGEAYVDPEDPTLTIHTWYYIEDYWDFGFVQVSTDNGETWTSLSNEYTTYQYDPSAYYEITDNLPGLTGYSRHWIKMSFDLSAYANQTVMIGFRYMTDWGYLEEGWYIKSVKVSGTEIINSLEKVETRPPSYFTVTVIRLVGNPNKPSQQVVKSIDVLEINHTDETGEIFIEGTGGHVLLIVSNPSDTTEFQYGLADYEITIQS